MLVYISAFFGTGSYTLKIFLTFIYFSRFLSLLSFYPPYDPLYFLSAIICCYMSNKIWYVLHFNGAHLSTDLSTRYRHKCIDVLSININQFAENHGTFSTLINYTLACSLPSLPVYFLLWFWHPLLRSTQCILLFPILSDSFNSIAFLFHSYQKKK